MITLTVGTKTWEFNTASEAAEFRNQMDMNSPTSYAGPVRTNRVKKMQKAMLEAARAVKGDHPDVAKQLRAAQRPGKIGGAKPGAGRPTMFPGKKVKLTIIITEDAKALVDAERVRLTRSLRASPERLRTVNDSATIERLIRKATKTR